MGQCFDLVIIGAGPAGSAAAMQARTLGLSVALVDKASFPRVKLCGGLITGRAAKSLKSVFDLDITAELFDTRHNFEFHMNEDALGRLENVPPLHLTMRYDFDKVLLDKAIDAGAVDFTGHRIDQIDLPRDRIVVQDNTVLNYRCLIGADGVKSQVAASLFGRSFHPRKIGFALEVESPADDPDDATPLRIDFAAAQWGYGWVFPKRGSTTIGVGGVHHHNPRMKPQLQAYLAKLGAGQTAKIKGHFLPFGEAKRHPGRGHVLLVGDAAGLVDPITGEGIGHAMHSGAEAAVAAHRAIQEGQPVLAYRYYRSMTRPIRASVGFARLLRPLIFAPYLQPFFGRTFKASQSLKREFMYLLSGDTEYPVILRRVIRRLPGAALRHIRASQR